MSIELIPNPVKSPSLVHVVAPPQRIPARELHKYVVGLVGVFVLIVTSYPIAMNRVTQNGKFATYKSHLKSLTLEYKPSKPQAKTSTSLTASVQTPDLVVTNPEHTLDLH